MDDDEAVAAADGDTTVADARTDEGRTAEINKQVCDITYPACAKTKPVLSSRDREISHAGCKD